MDVLDDLFTATDKNIRKRFGMSVKPDHALRGKELKLQSGNDLTDFAGKVYKGETGSGVKGLPKGDPMWWSGFPEVAAGYTRKAQGARVLQTTADDLAKLGPVSQFTPHVAKDNRVHSRLAKWLKGEAGPTTQAAGRNQAWGNNPNYEMVATVPKSVDDLMRVSKTYAQDAKGAWRNTWDPSRVKNLKPPITRVRNKLPLVSVKDLDGVVPGGSQTAKNLGILSGIYAGVMGTGVGIHHHFNPEHYDAFKKNPSWAELAKL
jgi:hypothetical protein